MDKLIGTIKQLKIKTKSAKKNELSQTCKKLQAIIDRRLLHEERKHTPSYTDDLYFYSIFIPNLVSEMQEYTTDLQKTYILKKKANEWTKKNIVRCAKYIEMFDKGRLTDESPSTPSTPKKSPKK